MSRPPAPRGTCPNCRRSIALLIDGRIRRHGQYVEGRRLAGDCTGSYQPPAIPAGASETEG
jgi:hypothetical protein